MRKQQTNPTGRTKTLRRPTHTQAFEVMEFQVNLKTCKGQNRPRSCDSQIYYTVLDWKYYTVLDWIYYTILDWIPEQKKKKWHWEGQSHPYKPHSFSGQSSRPLYPWEIHPSFQPAAHCWDCTEHVDDFSLSFISPSTIQFKNSTVFTLWLVLEMI